MRMAVLYTFACIGFLTIVVGTGFTGLCVWAWWTSRIQEHKARQRKLERLKRHWAFVPAEQR